MAEMSAVRESSEFHIVVRRPGRGSPLAPYRFVITLAFALAVCGMPLWEAVESGASVDDALVRVGGAALFAWFVLGRINSILNSASDSTTVLQPGSGDDVDSPAGVAAAPRARPSSRIDRCTGSRHSTWSDTRVVDAGRIRPR